MKDNETTAPQVRSISGLNSGGRMRVSEVAWWHDMRGNATPLINVGRKAVHACRILR